MFFCHRCDNLADSDDGCKEGPRFSLICSDCMDNEPDENWPGDGTFTAEQQRIIDAHKKEDDGDGPEQAAEAPVSPSTAGASTPPLLEGQQSRRDDEEHARHFRSWP